MRLLLLRAERSFEITRCSNALKIRCYLRLLRAPPPNSS